ncbi:MAG TPA: hypothetical protein VGD45_05640 [Steroidobacter sp.]|uniref:hypothetical protein n=1 Tax=Steroidobacter sp. TaxID=1978227 RepID=UPI002ED9F022
MSTKVTIIEVVLRDEIPLRSLAKLSQLENTPLGKVFERFDSSLMSERTTYEVILEWDPYQSIPGRKETYREDKASTHKHPKKHVHVFAGRGKKRKQLYSINEDGTGHDGSRGKRVDDAIADFFRSKGYTIPEDNILKYLPDHPIDDEPSRLILVEIGLERTSGERTLHPI